MPETAEPVLRIPSRRDGGVVESNAILERGFEALKEYRKELSEIRTEYDARMNGTLEPGAGLYPFYQSLGLGFQGGGPFQDTQALGATLALSNGYFPITMNWSLISNSYMSQGLIRTYVDQVVEDAFGDGIQFKTAQLDDEELAELNRAFKQKRPLESYARTRMVAANVTADVDLSMSDQKACSLTAKWGRLFGGSGLIVNTTQSMNRQFRPELITEDTPLTFIAADRWELVMALQNINADMSGTPYEYYGNPLHRSRVSRFVWADAPSRIRQRLGGWGMSVLEEAIAPINAYLKFRKVIFELMDESKVDVFHIKGFNANLATARGTEALSRRVQIANQAKNFQNALTMDLEDEYEQKNLGSIFPGLASIWQELRVDLCAYMKMPMNKLFGQSAGGFSSGKDSLDNYNSTVRNLRTEIEPTVITAGGLRCQQMFRIIPADLEVSWVPLAVLDGVEQEAVKTSIQKRIESRFSLGLTTGIEALQEMRKNELIDCDETEVEQGLRDVEPPLSENPDEAQAGRDHEMSLKRTDAAKKTPKAGKGSSKK